METLDCIYTRRSIRKYKDIPVEWELVGRVVEAASFAPTAGNIQDYRFIVVWDEDKRKQIAQACLQQYWMESAPVHIVACAERAKAKQFYGIRGERLYTIQNVAAAMENMLLAAHNFGLGACWVGAFDEAMIKRICGIPDYARAHAIMTLGHPDEVPPQPQKYKLENLFYLERYNNRMKDVNVVLGEYSPVIARSVKEALDKGTNKLLDHIEKKVKEVHSKLKGKKK
ncbi:MAG: nitroreductase family protein [Candidatus Woesearchaeota archaeon]